MTTSHNSIAFTTRPLRSLAVVQALFLIISLCAAPAAAQSQEEDPAKGSPMDPGPVRIGPVTLSGSAWLESVVTTDDEEQGDSMFRIGRARLGLAGALTSRIDWNISGELTAQPALRNAFVMIRVADQLSVRVGQANLPSGIERSTSTLNLDFVDRSRATNELSPGRESGVTFMNTAPFHGWASYSLGLFNGNGYNRADDNSAKDISGWLSITPPAVDGLSIITTGGTGEQPDGRRTRAGFGVQYDVRSLKVLAEGLRQTLADLPAARGAVALVLYRFHPRQVTPHFRMLEIAARYSVLDDPHPNGGGAGSPDEDGAGSGAVGDVAREIQLGVNYFVNSYARFAWNMMIPNDHREASGPIFVTRLQVVF
ncbi:MAG: porin [Vicinamibacterales bacterium]